MRIPRTGGRRSQPGPGLGLVTMGLLVAGISLAGVTGCGRSSEAQTGGSAGTAATQAARQEEEPAEDAIAIEVGHVSRGALSALYATSATLRADKRATVTARTRGVVRELLAEEGDWVEESQPLAVLENDEQRIALEQAKASHDEKRRAFERAESLHGQSLMSDEAFETARREAVETRNSMDLAELELSRTVIRATFAGRVLERHLDVGATVNDGTPVYDIADLDPLYADVQVPEREVAQLGPGQTVRLMNDADESVGTARIERIAPAVDPSTGTIKVTVAVRQAEGLRPGSFVRVGIVTDTHENALLVPRSALVAEGRRWHLFRLKEGAKRVELIEVTRGLEESDSVEIVADSGAERPLGEGDPVVVTGASSLSDDSPVRVMNETTGDGETRAEEATDKAAEAAEARNRDDKEHGVAA